MMQFPQQQQMVAAPKQNQRRAPMALNVKEVCVGDDETNYSYKAFDHSRLVFGNLTTCELPASSGVKGTYQTVSVSYNYGTAENSRIMPFKLEGPVERSNFCISSMVDDKTGKVSHSILSRMDPNNGEHVKYSEVLHQIYRAICRYAIINRSSLGFYDMKLDENSDYTQFTMVNPFPFVGWPIRYPNVKGTKQLDTSKPPMVVHKVTIGGRKATVFTNRTIPPKPVNVSILQVCEFDFIALDDMSSIYISSAPKAFMQIKTESAIIMDVIPPNNTTNQGRTLKSLASTDADKAAEFDKRIEQIMAAQQQAPKSEAPPSAVQSQQMPFSPKDATPSLPPPSQGNYGENRTFQPQQFQQQNQGFNTAPPPALPPSFGQTQRNFTSSSTSSYNDHSIPPRTNNNFNSQGSTNMNGSFGGYGSNLSTPQGSTPGNWSGNLNNSNFTQAPQYQQGPVMTQSGNGHSISKFQ